MTTLELDLNMVDDNEVEEIMRRKRNEALDFADEENRKKKRKV